MSQLLDFERMLVHDCQVAAARCLVIGVSGGPDSLGLLHRLHVLSATFGWRLHVAHLDHGLRGEQSAAEARFVAGFAADLGLAATVELRDVDALAQRYGVGLPTAARAARYAFLADVALAQDADAVVVAHQADDQAETVLLHLVRGAGPSGLMGMLPRLEWPAWRAVAGRSQPSGPALIRPLLGIPRSEIEEYCQLHDLQPRRDPSNDSLEYRRGKLRHQVLPLLRTLNPQVVPALSRTAALAASEADFMRQMLAERWPQLVELQAGTVLIRREPWAQTHPALRRLALREVVRQLRPEHTDVSASHLDQMLLALEAEALVHQLAHGLVLHREPAGWLVTLATNRQALSHEPQLLVDELPLAAEGLTRLPGGHWRISLAQVAGRPEANLTRWQILLDATALQGQLRLRQRLPGDRIRPAGGAGSRRVQDVMVDLRLPRELRAQWPLLADDAGLLWLPGLVVDERVYPSPDTPAYLLVTLEEVEHGL